MAQNIPKLVSLLGNSLQRVYPSPPQLCTLHGSARVLISVPAPLPA